MRRRFLRRSHGPAAALLLACAGAGACAVDPVHVCRLPPPPVSVTVAPASDTVAVGDAASFRVVVTLPAGIPGDPCSSAPDPTASRAATWELSNPAVATIVSANDSMVVVRGAGAGTTSVIATAKADATAKGAGLLVVQPLIAPGGALSQRHPTEDR